MSNPVNHQQFLYDTVDRIQGELTKFIFKTNYSNPYSIYLREQLDDFKKSLEKKKFKIYRKSKRINTKYNFTNIKTKYKSKFILSSNNNISIKIRL